MRCSDICTARLSSFSRPVRDLGCCPAHGGRTSGWIYRLERTTTPTSDPSPGAMTLATGVSSTQKVGWGQGYSGANINVGSEQRLEMHVRSSFTVVNLHDLWSNYPVRYRQSFEKWGKPGASPNSEGMAPISPVE